MRLQRYDQHEIERDVTELGHVSNFIECIDRLFGEIAADVAREATARLRRE